MDKEQGNETEPSLGNKGKKSIRTFILLFAAFLMGTASFVGYKFVTYKSDNVHYHANFMVYINGAKNDFKDLSFYEEVQACASDDHDNPRHRVHMHDENPSLVHVHAHAVAWGHFFANIGYTLGDTVLKTDDGIFIDNVDGNRLQFILNGKQVSAISNRLIHSEDKLLVYYGKEDNADVMAQYAAIPHDATEANTKYDPAGCSGGEQLTPLQRLKVVLGSK